MMKVARVLQMTQKTVMRNHTTSNFLIGHKNHRTLTPLQQNYKTH